ncbi:pentapeptide repeat-containing protein [Mycobacterium antarcticum]|uniref:pentapeptide repeat-containing protein n=1 Tax=Mycolicibacterium sp. TUM20985 TaxID=3023370 RepID=UPI0025723187|nr:pentapeptide repeat-containing protein [Mycolicibacterium sp. TUM20985]
MVTAIGAPILALTLLFLVPLAGWLRSPPWWFRDVVIAGLIATVLLFSQKAVDDERAIRDRDIAATQASQAERLENLRFVRDRSSGQDQAGFRAFGGFDLTDMNLSGLILRGADFSAADLEGSNLSGTDLSWPRLDLTGESRFLNFGTRSDLTGANLCHAKLSRATFDFALLTRANMTGADVRGTVLDWADLSGADLSGANLDGASMKGVYYDTTTVWPKGFRPPELPRYHDRAYAQYDQTRSSNLAGLRNDLQRPRCRQGG